MYRRYYRVPSVWHDMDRLQREMNRLFDDYSPSRLRAAPGYPALNIWTSQEGLAITAEVPGVSPEEMEISVVGDTLTLSGTRKADELKEGARYHRQERGYGSFTRSIQLPYPVDVNKVEATFKDGILKIAMPRSEADKPRKIIVKSA